MAVQSNPTYISMRDIAIYSVCVFVRVWVRACVRFTYAWTARGMGGGSAKRVRSILWYRPGWRDEYNCTRELNTWESLCARIHVQTITMGGGREKKCSIFTTTWLDVQTQKTMGRDKKCSMFTTTWLDELRGGKGGEALLSCTIIEYQSDRQEKGK